MASNQGECLLRVSASQDQGKSELVVARNSDLPILVDTFLFRGKIAPLGKTFQLKPKFLLRYFERYLETDFQPSGLASDEFLDRLLKTSSCGQDFSNRDFTLFRQGNAGVGKFYVAISQYLFDALEIEQDNYWQRKAADKETIFFRPRQFEPLTSEFFIRVSALREMPVWAAPNMPDDPLEASRLLEQMLGEMDRLQQAKGQRVTQPDVDWNTLNFFSYEKTNVATHARNATLRRFRALDVALRKLCDQSASGIELSAYDMEKRSV